MNFLLNHEDTRYKLTSCASDLTAIQIHFMYICAKKKYDEMEAAMQGQNNDFHSHSPLEITDKDSPEVINEKLALIKECIR